MALRSGLVAPVRGVSRAAQEARGTEAEVLWVEGCTQISSVTAFK